MENETFECTHKRAFASKDGGGKYSIYVTKDDGTEMGKWYQTASSVELLDGEVAPVPASSNGVASAKDPAAQWKEKYRLTMSNLLSAAIQSGKEVNFSEIDGYVRKILSAQYDGDEAPF